MIRRGCLEFTVSVDTQAELCKDLINRVPAMTRAEAFAWTAEQSGAYFRSQEAAEGITAFLQKRSPHWV